MPTVDSVYFWGEFTGSSGTVYATYNSPKLIANLGTGGLPSPLGAVTMLDAENGWVAALIGGLPYGFGGNDENVLNQQATTSFLTPVALVGQSPFGNTAYDWATVGATLPFIQVDGGNSFAIALDSAGAVWAWGNVVSGNMGNNNTTTAPQATPTQVYAVGSPTGSSKLVLLEAFNAISAGAQHWVGITPSNGVIGCGDNTYGECGNAIALPTGGAQQNIPVTVVGGAQGGTNLVNIVAISTGVTSVAALDNTLSGGGLVWCWGRNNFGQCGDGTNTDRSSPVALDWVNNGGVSPIITAISVGGGGSNSNGHVLALDKNGNVWAWGSNSNGQLGANISPGTNSNVPVQVHVIGPVNGAAAVTVISAGGDHSLALDANGQLWGWGDYTYLGGGLFGNQEIPVVRNILPASATVNKIWAGNKCSTVDVSMPPVTQPVGVTPARIAGFMAA